MRSTLSTKMKWAVGAIFTIASLVFIIFLGSSVLKNIAYNEEGVLQLASVSEAPLGVAAEVAPKYFYFNKGSNVGPNVSALSYLVGDLDTGEIVLVKNKDQRMSIASVTKLMTALVAREISDAEDVALVSKKALSTYGGNGSFSVGEKVKISDLFYPLLLESSNDAAEILAEHFGRDIFIEKMNREAEILRMSATSYEDPSGLSVNNQSTVYDIFKLVGYIKKEKRDLLQITTARSYSSKSHNWSSNNQFLREIGYLGGKSGYTDPAKQTVVSLFSLPLGENGNRSLAITLLGSKDRYKDVENIVKYLQKYIYYGGEVGANNAWVKQQNGIPEIKDPDFVTFTFLGDIMLDRGVKNSVIKNFAGDYSALFERLETLKKSDIVFANLEGTASDKGKDSRNLYSFRMDPSILPALRGAGISILSVANNHIGDFGHEAYVDTLARLQENEILYTGGGITSDEAERPQIIEKYGMKIGFIGFSDQGPDWMRAKEGQAGILLASNPRFEEIIQNASRQVDYLVVSFHFGEEYQTEHDDRQESLAHRAIDNGAKIVVGHHPHVMQDTEVYSSKDCTQSSCVGYIIYSLGNFIFDQGFSEDTMQGLMLGLKLWRDGSISVTKNILKLNRVFQPDTIIKGKEEKLKFAETLIP
ncbi:hypothetical protein A3C67_00680 [Candidatus Nomurabacteria bacterium RIFCSPHIGHO2_02_FULL_42_19]|uniref:Capsule synthesis protein CapA domain-containing protein n=1 Tax=Candidatus Nomurabacteria bacterium RIFCSPHIGHO2_02_FULL_42_19 TaxID=1801756 RepID=A0A1F6W105_9BACT|nr:MAG: hypothetical protein A3C67_00680 [Candidatus Nomurabacteria bacterium RIFCSPHIGHO2_02_FULL_42_19]